MGVVMSGQILLPPAYTAIQIDTAGSKSLIRTPTVITSKSAWVKDNGIANRY
jgi:hypothetical protein